MTRGPKPRDLTGVRFGKLRVLSLHHRTPKNTWWLCQCDCGNIKNICAGNMTRKSTRRTYSCGCYGKIKDITHGACIGGKTPEYRAYIRSKVRCKTPAKQKWYWDVEFKFTSFEQWLAELGPQPTPKHEVDRWPNPAGHYEPGNVRWATRTQQMNNLRKHGVAKNV